MTLAQRPRLAAPLALQGAEWELPERVLSRWSADLRAERAQTDAVISILDEIGDDWNGGGITARRVSAALRQIGPRSVTVEINSPGGDMFEGVAIYNALLQHPARVEVEVLGLAASAASIIAMAGDEVLMAPGSFMMIHRCWGVGIGNCNELRERADAYEQFDGAMAAIYEARTGQDRAQIDAWMDVDTFFSPETAIENGFADRQLERALTEAQASSGATALRQIDLALAKAGHSRKARRALLSDLRGAPEAVATPMPSAGSDWASDFAACLETLSA